MKMNFKLYTALMSVVFIAASCSSSSSGGDDSPPPPPPNSAPSSVSQLVFPSSDLLCIDNTVAFQWGAATDVDGDAITYKLVIATNRPLTEIVEQRTVSQTTVTISLQVGTAYYWRVTAMDDQGAESTPSNTFAFYTEGDAVSNYAPFTAALNAPDNEGTITAGTVNLSWTGGDANPADSLTYDLYFGETMDPILLREEMTEENFDVTASAGTTYYWRVDTIDDQGAKTIGQIWTFSTN